MSCASLQFAIDIYQLGLGLYMDQPELWYWSMRCVGLS